MTTAQIELRQSILDRAFGFREPCFDGFRDVDFQVLQIALDVAFCSIARVSEIRGKAEAAGIKAKTIIAALCKLAEREMIYPCTDPATGIECVQVVNFEGLTDHIDIDDMITLE